MKIYATKVWEFNPESWPIIAFGKGGNRDKLLQKAELGDLIILVATTGENVKEHERGKILGVAEIGGDTINNVEEFLLEINQSGLDKSNYNEDNNFKWRYAIPMIRAWYFLDKPDVKNILEEQLLYNSAFQAVLLDENDAAEILKLTNVREAEIPQNKIISKLRERSKSLSRNTFIPAAWTANLTRETGNVSVTYVMRFGNSDCWKIGYSSNLEERRSALNQHIPHEIDINLQWLTRYQKTWPNEKEAHAMEQKILHNLKDKRMFGERVMCSEAEIKTAFQKAIP